MGWGCCWLGGCFRAAASAHWNPYPKPWELGPWDNTMVGRYQRSGQSAQVLCVYLEKAAMLVGVSGVSP